MGLIPGERLDRAWPTLRWWAKLRVAWTLRSYGPWAPAPGSATARPSGTRAPARWDPRDFFAYVRRNVFAVEYAWRDVAHLVREHKPLVFTHHDLNMRNTILGDDGNVWLIDFAWSGLYAVYSEAMAIAAQERGEEADHP